MVGGRTTRSRSNGDLATYPPRPKVPQRTGHAVAFLDAFVYGFALQEAMLPFDGTDEVHELAVEVLAAMPADEYPHFVAFAREHVLQPDYDFSAEFDVGLGFVLDSIAGLPSAPRARRKGHR